MTTNLTTPQYLDADKMAEDIRLLGQKYCTDSWLLMQDPDKPDVLYFFTHQKKEENYWYPLFSVTMTQFVSCLLGMCDPEHWPKGMTLLFLYEFSQHIVKLLTESF